MKLEQERRYAIAHDPAKSKFTVCEVIRTELSHHGTAEEARAAVKRYTEADQRRTTGDAPPEQGISKPEIVREFSPAGPCIPLGPLYKETKSFYFYSENNVAHKIKKGGRAHIVPCPSCRDHAKTQYPHGYMD